MGSWQSRMTKPENRMGSLPRNVGSKCQLYSNGQFSCEEFNGRFARLATSAAILRNGNFGFPGDTAPLEKMQSTSASEGHSKVFIGPPVHNNSSTVTMRLYASRVPLLGVFSLRGTFASVCCQAFFALLPLLDNALLVVPVPFAP